jgi:hypothetical protein
VVVVASVICGKSRGFLTTRLATVSAYALVRSLLDAGKKRLTDHQKS